MLPLWLATAGCYCKTLLYQVFTCFSLDGLAEDAGALSVTGSHRQRIQPAALKPCEHVGRLSGGGVGTGAPNVLRADQVVRPTFWTRVPAHCDVIVAACGHSSHTGRRADDCAQARDSECYFQGVVNSIMWFILKTNNL